MNEHWRRNIIRGIFLLTIQLLLFKRVNLTIGDFNYVHLTIYALFFALLPYNLPRPILILIGFCTGLFVDIFYDSIGVHAGASTLICFAKYYILLFLAPREGYKKTALTPFQYGVPWFLSYISLFLIIHLFSLYALEAFSLVYIKEIVFRTIFSFFASLFIIMVGMLIFNPKT